MNLLNKLDLHEKNKTLKFIESCQTETGGFGGSIGHDSHITSTHYSLLILSQFGILPTKNNKKNQNQNNVDKNSNITDENNEDKIENNKNSEEVLYIPTIDYEKIALYIKSLQQPDGSFKCDFYGEIDTRFSYCAVAVLKLLNKLDPNYINLKTATEYVLSCQNFDGGFGGIPGAESHAAYAFCCIGFLAVTNQICLIDTELTGQWLAARQTHSGGFNGRPEKLPDVCYSWWVLSAMFMIYKSNYIDLKLLEKFILECQDDEGGIADRPGNNPDVFHTFFGLAGLSLMGYKGLKSINAVYAIPEEVVKDVII